MTAAADQSNFPTMIIPRGTEIRVNAQGQLSIKTPGNLVIQNSGNYSELESTNGSIRIEENVTVEAVSVRAAQACFIQGSLTAWRVHAKRISLEERGRAFIMLQESEQLELAKSARLVGNFSSEKELFLMMGKFSSQLKELPGGFDLNASTPSEMRPAMNVSSISHAPAVAQVAPFPQTVSAAARSESMRADELPETLRVALTLLEREVRRADLLPSTVEGIQEVIFALREHNLPRVHMIYRDALADLGSRSDSLRIAFENIDRHFAPRSV
jgi:hypothetical protein